MVFDQYMQLYIASEIIDPLHPPPLPAPPLPAPQSKAALMYTESIEKLKAVLSAMQNMSKKREGLERRLHTALEGEITQLREARPVARRWGVPSNKESGLADKTTIAKLEADVAKVRVKLYCFVWPVYIQSAVTWTPEII